MEDLEQTSSPLRVPETIDEEWLHQALRRGRVEHNGKMLFVRPFDPSLAESVWLEENYGPVGDPEKIYTYSAFPAELIPSYLRLGLLAVPESINLSGVITEQVAEYRREFLQQLKLQRDTRLAY